MRPLDAGDEGCLPDDVVAKLSRASTHLTETYRLESELQNAARPRVELDRDGNQPCYRFRCDVPVGHEVGVLIGDIVHNLRCALDYSACRLARANCADADIAKVQFPFGQEEGALRARDLRAFPALNTAGLEYLEQARAAGGLALHLLRAMSNQDKHRLLVTHFFQTEQAGFTVDLTGAGGTVTAPALDTWKVNVPLDDGDVLAIGHDARFTPNFAFMLSFSIDGRRGAYRLSVLSAIYAKVREALIALAPALGQSNER